MKLNREQIVKALECQVGTDENHDCRGCYFYNERELCSENVSEGIATAALNVIRELTEENEGLEVDNEHLAIVVEGKLNRAQSLERLVMKLTDKVATVKADTVRKMQERLKGKSYYPRSHSTVRVVDEYDIDQIAKELLEENDGT